MLDAVVDYLPAPTDIPAIKGTLEDGEEVERHLLMKNHSQHCVQSYD